MIKKSSKNRSKIVQKTIKNPKNFAVELLLKKKIQKEGDWGRKISFHSGQKTMKNASCIDKLCHCFSDFFTPKSMISPLETTPKIVKKPTFRRFSSSKIDQKMIQKKFQKNFKKNLKKISKKIHFLLFNFIIIKSIVFVFNTL